VPGTNDEKAISKEHQKYGYQVLEQAVQSLEGLVIVWQCPQTKDAQTMDAKCQAQYAHSQAATLAQDTLKQRALQIMFYLMPLRKRDVHHSLLLGRTLSWI
jgi:hypothetical protein